MGDSSKSIQALQEFIILGKSAPGAAAIANIQKCIASPNTYVFAELLELPHVQALQTDGNPEHAQWVEVLKQFAYGDYMEYKKLSNSLPQLTDKQMTKLKQLSLISIASREPQNLTYAALMAQLDIPTIRALEDLVISAIYAELLEGKLDTAAQRVEVSSTAGRDVAPGDITHMIEVLTAWTAQCTSVLAEIDDQVHVVTRNAILQRMEHDRYEREVQERRISKDIKNSGGAGKGKRLIDGDDLMVYAGGGDDEMDLDDGPFGDDHQGAKKSKKGFPFGRRKR